jgi:hypothetical protein
VGNECSAGQIEDSSEQKGADDDGKLEKKLYVAIFNLH